MNSTKDLYFKAYKIEPRYRVEGKHYYRAKKLLWYEDQLRECGLDVTARIDLEVLFIYFTDNGQQISMTADPFAQDEFGVSLTNLLKAILSVINDYILKNPCGIESLEHSLKKS